MVTPEAVRSNRQRFKEAWLNFRWTNLPGICKRGFFEITIEPIILLFFAAKNMYQLILTTSLYTKICRHNFRFEPGVDCDELKNSPHIETKVQQMTATWQMYISLAYVLPIIFMSPIMGAFGDRHGRKINILVGMTGFTLSATINLAEYVFMDDMPLFWLPLTLAFISLTGYVGNVHSSVYAYLADRIHDKSMLTIRFTILQLLTNGADIVASYFTAFLLRRMPQYKAMLVPQVLWTISFFYALLMLRQEPPDLTREIEEVMQERKLSRKESKGVVMNQRKKSRQAELSAPTSPAFDEHSGENGFNSMELAENGNLEKDAVAASRRTARQSTESSISDSVFDQCNGATSQKRHLVKTRADKNVSFCAKILGVFVTSWRLLKESAVAALKPREGRFRLYIWITFISFTIINTTNIGFRTVLKLFKMHPPLSWKPAEIADYNGFEHIIHLLGNLISIVLLKCVNAHETTIILVSILSMIGRQIMIGLSVNTLMMYVAAVVGIVGNLAFPVMKSMVCQFVQPDEVGRIYALFQYATDFGILVSHTGFNILYRETVAFLPGFVFFLVAGLLTTALAPILWLHVHYRRYRRSKSELSIGELIVTHSVANGTTIVPTPSRLNLCN